MLDLTKPIEVLPAMSAGFCVRHLAELRDTAFEPPLGGFPPNSAIIAEHDNAWGAYRRLFEAAPKMLTLLQMLMNFRDNEAYRPQIVAECKALIAKIEEQTAFDSGELTSFFDPADLVRHQNRAKILSNVSDLALIDMHLPDTAPLETGVSDFGFVNKFDASGRSLSGGDIA